MGGGGGGVCHKQASHSMLWKRGCTCGRKVGDSSRECVYQNSRRHILGLRATFKFSFYRNGGVVSNQQNKKK